MKNTRITYSLVSNENGRAESGGWINCQKLIAGGEVE